MRRTTRLFVMGTLILVGAALSGCTYRGGAWYETSYHHVHGRGCGHYYWHDAWRNKPHANDCGDAYCDVRTRRAGEVLVEREAPPAGPESDVPVTVSAGSTRVVYVDAPPVEVYRYYWHGSYHLNPHPYPCGLCSTRSATVRIYDRSYPNSYVHGSSCGCSSCRGPVIRVGTSVGWSTGSSWSSRSCSPVRVYTGRRGVQRSGFSGRVRIGR